MKAKFIGKTYGTGYDRNSIYLEYEYRGMRYTVHENRAKGQEPLAWQHKSEQNRIDSILDTKQATATTAPAQEGFDLLWEYFEGRMEE